jgi:predicted RecA/RadA family phage recombinase
MRNYVQMGDLIPVTAPRDLTSGTGVLVGTLFGVATKATTNGTVVTIQTYGVVDLPKAATITPAEGTALYWDNTNFVVTATASGNTLIGKAVIPLAAAGDATIRVRLNG